MKRPRTTLAVSLFISAISLFFSSGLSAQTANVLLDEIPKGVLNPCSFRQRLDIEMNGPNNGLTRSITITSKVSLV